MSDVSHGAMMAARAALQLHEVQRLGITPGKVYLTRHEHGDTATEGMVRVHNVADGTVHFDRIIIEGGEVCHRSRDRISLRGWAEMVAKGQIFRDEAAQWVS